MLATYTGIINDLKADKENLQKTDPFLTFHLAGVIDIVVSSLVLAAAQLKSIFSSYLLIRTATELTVELSLFLAAAFASHK